ncbi:MAG: hypothetical protein NTV00_16910 [Methylococcales bacterium]|nr:hypothetical protein [Methylococcales bacterium]
MPFFICLSLAISFLVQSHHRLEAILLSVWTEYFGIGCIIVGILLMLARKLTLSIRYDLFCSGVLCVWISTWPPFFNPDSPVIFFYPLFFCFVTVAVNFLFIQQAATIDPLTLSYLIKFTNNRFFHTGLIMAGVLYSLTQTDNYRLFPNIMALMILKYALVSIVQGRQSEDLPPKSP